MGPAASASMGTWCTEDGAPNCVALLAYACLFQHEMRGSSGRVKMKKERITYGTNGKGDGPDEVSTAGWLDRTCWTRDSSVTAQEIIPYATGDDSAYQSDHAP